MTAQPQYLSNPIEVVLKRDYKSIIIILLFIYLSSRETIKMNIYELKLNQELRFQVGDEPIKLELRRGLAEVYGTEMLLNKTYTFSKNTKAAVFTYQGATIEFTGSPLKCHVGQKCDYMTCYLNIHGDLEKMREEAEKLSEQFKFNVTSSSQNPISSENIVATGSQSIADEPMAGDSQQHLTIMPDLSKTPICLVCKPMYARNVGKSTLCRILLNYATRRGRAPIFVDLDPDQGHIGIPGTIGALSIESPIDIETGLSLRSSMLMHFGHTNLAADNEDKNGLFYKALLENMAKIVHSKLEQDKKSYYSGVIINTSAWSDDVGYKILVHACKVFKANIILVMDDEVLQDDLKKDLGADNGVATSYCQQVNVLNVPKTVGLITRLAETNVELRYNRIKQYFYGTAIESFNPMTSEIKFAFLKRLIYRVGNPLMLPASLMPIGTDTQECQVKVSHYSDCTASDLLHHILAISYSRIDDVVEDPEVVLKTNVMGFICITSVRGADGDIVSILTPQKLPSPMDHVLLYSDVQYMDSLI